jgi:hypothetical protein
LDTRRKTIRAAGVVFVAVGLTLVFWLCLWTGGGLVGSDIYAYFLPQKAFFAEQLREGALPIWNNRIGWGYPQLAESQTGVFYPLNLPLYYWLDLNSAFNASQIVHYVLAFVFTWMFARQIGLAPIGAGLASLVFTYGWFPARICLEWAIVGGAWLPLALWCVERFLQTRAWRFAIGLTVVLGVQMLAGHFTLAFVSQLTVVAYVLLRLWFGSGESHTKCQESPRAAGAVLAVAIAGAFLLAAVQLLPTWELKQQSQRKGLSAEHDPGYGYIPPRYLLQVVAPWHWYIGDQAFNETILVGGPRTNRVEAHLYFGLLPMALAGWAFWTTRRRLDRRLAIWLGLGLGAVAYATGILIPVTKHLPGFSFFEGPGRFGIVATLAVGLWAGFGFDRFLQRCRGSGRRLVIAFVFALSIGDLWLVSRQTVADPWLMTEIEWLVGPQSKFVYLVSHPPVKRLDSSPLRKILSQETQPVRLFSEGKNLPSMLGAATLPTYLGLGPSAYFDPNLQLPGEFDFRQRPTDEQIAWFRRAGVTHLLSFVRLESSMWPIILAWAGVDPFLNQTLARGGNEPLFLYRLSGSRNRLAWSDSPSDRSARLVEYQPCRITIETASKGDGRLILTDLAYPGWRVTVDGEPANSLISDEIFRSVDVPAGNHTVVWNYRPRSLYWGAGMSLVTLVTLLILGHLRYWHADWFAAAVPPTERL